MVEPGRSGFEAGAGRAGGAGGGLKKPRATTAHLEFFYSGHRFETPRFGKKTSVVGQGNDFIAHYLTSSMAVMDMAPRDPAPVIHAGEGIPWTSRQGQELALLCWHCGEVGHMLIRSAWHTRDGRDGAWWDRECGEPDRPGDPGMGGDADP